VTLWTTRDTDGRPAGLTLSSTVVIDGDPGRVLGVLDEESTLWEALRGRHKQNAADTDANPDGGRFVLAPLRESDGQLADIFAGLMPSPGGPFVGRQWDQTRWGPVLAGVSGWAGCRLDGWRPMGWGLLVEATIEHVEITDEDPVPLLHYRGRYLAGPPTG
jgi:flavin reductase (DIM6/NTAB) family NADH-FMN oxidoreductase RutF